MKLKGIYMSVGVRIRLLHWQIHATERRIIGFILAKQLVVEIAVLRWPKIVLSHARQSGREILRLSGIAWIRCWKSVEWRMLWIRCVGDRLW